MSSFYSSACRNAQEASSKSNFCLLDASWKLDPDCLPPPLERDAEGEPEVVLSLAVQGGWLNHSVATQNLHSAVAKKDWRIVHLDYAQFCSFSEPNIQTTAGRRGEVGGPDVKRVRHRSSGPRELSAYFEARVRRARHDANERLNLCLLAEFDRRTTEEVDSVGMPVVPATRKCVNVSLSTPGEIPG
jgi:hypothetical protein